MQIAQSKTPDYKEVTKKFIKTYRFSEDHNMEYKLAFAKKKQGWFVYKYFYRDTINSERDFQLFWSNKDQMYLKLNYEFIYKEEAKELNIESERAKYASFYSTYNFDHCIYAGYRNWDFDVINDLSNKPDLNEQELESLARAYSNYAMGFLWSVYGEASNEKEISRQPLQRCEQPSRERATAFALYVNKGIEICKRLERKNPNFQTMVGDIHTKLSGEYMYAYTFLTYSGNDDLAAVFLADSLYDKYVLASAKNYLKFLKQDAVLFTQGDLDTYPLIYLQEKFNYRKDVTVLNSGQLQSPAYLNYYTKKSRSVFPREYDNFYCCKQSDYLSISTNSFESTLLPINEFWEKLQEIGNNCDDAKLAEKLFNKVKFYVSSLNPVNIKLPELMYLYDISQLVIIINNLKRRPVYFANTVQSDLYKSLYPYTNTTGLVDEFLQDSRLDKYPINTFIEINYSASYNTIDTAAVRLFLETADFTINKDDKQLITNSELLPLIYSQYCNTLVTYINALVENKKTKTATNFYTKHEDLFYFNNVQFSIYTSMLQLNTLCKLKLFSNATTAILRDLEHIDAQPTKTDKQTVNYFLTEIVKILDKNNLPEKSTIVAKLNALKLKLEID
jgi:hypothetical protein